MNAKPVIFLALAAFAGVALAANVRRPGATGEGAVDWPDPPSDPVSWLDATAGDWGPSAVLGEAAAVFDDVAQVVAGGDPMSGAQSLSYAGLQNLKQEEGFSSTRYWDHKGYSIGYGHLIRPGENLTYVTEPQGEELLLQDVAWAEAVVRAKVRVPLTQNQFDALTLFAYNIGAGAFGSSTLVRLLNAGDYGGAAGQFGRWVNASGKELQVLVERREREQTLFES